MAEWSKAAVLSYDARRNNTALERGVSSNLTHVNSFYPCFDSTFINFCYFT